MSFSFMVPAGPTTDFADRAAAAKASLEASSANNDYALTQLASDTADVAIKAATDLVDALGDGTVTSATITGHHADDGISSSSVSIGVTVAPVQPTAADGATGNA